MTIEEACRLLDPATTAEELAKIEYYHGFSGKKACIEAIDEACTILVEFARSHNKEWTGFVDFSPAASWAASSPWQLPRPAAKRRWICTRRTGTRRSIRSKQRARRWTRSRKAAKYED